ncbi:MAG: hypothetical protein ACLUE2_04355 [Bacteroides cellulosilyticus]
MKRRDIISNLTIMLSLVFLLSCSENQIFHEVENDEITNLKIPMTTAEVLSIAYDDTNNDLSENEVLNYVREFKVASQTRSSSTITNVNIVDKYYTGNNTKQELEKHYLSLSIKSNFRKMEQRDALLFLETKDLQELLPI